MFIYDALLAILRVIQKAIGSLYGVVGVGALLVSFFVPGAFLIMESFGCHAITAPKHRSSRRIPRRKSSQNRIYARIAVLT